MTSPRSLNLNHNKACTGCLDNYIMCRVWDALSQYIPMGAFQVPGLCARGSVLLVRKRSRECSGMPEVGSGPRLTSPDKGSLWCYKEHPSGVGCGSQIVTPCFPSGVQVLKQGE